MKTPNDFPRLRLAVLPTPVYRLENLSARLGRNIYIKRDDLTGVALGGNKVRKLEFLLADARRQGARVVLTTGGAQSNHAMLTAACALRLGMEPILVLKARGETRCRGNLLLNRLMGVQVRFLDTDSYQDVYREMDRIARQREAQGDKCYQIPVGGSVPLGCLGYVDCIRELAEQTRAMGVSIHRIVCATGSGGTHAGVALGTMLYMPETRVTGMAVDTDPFEKIVPALMRQTAELLEWDRPIRDEDVQLRAMYGAGYAIPSPQGERAVKRLARTEGLFLDPVYTGKAFAGLLEMVEEGLAPEEENILFLHTGGAGGLFAAGDPA